MNADPAWAFAIVLLMLILLEWRLLARLHHGRVKMAEDYWLKMARRALERESKPSTEQVIASALRCFPVELDGPLLESPETVRRLVAHLAEVDQNLYKEAYDQAIKPSVDAWNTVATLAEDSLIRLSDTFLNDEEILHQALLEWVILEPFVWHESVIKDVGRWGYRMLQLTRCANKLRSQAFSEHLRGNIFVERPNADNRRPLLIAEELGTIKRLWLRVGSAIRPPAITNRTKSRQESEAEILYRSLDALPIKVHSRRPSTLW